MAGPETPLALGQQGIDEAMSAATAGSMGIAGVEQPTASTRGAVNIAQPAPAQQGGGGIEMQAPEYGWRVGQDDFGQKPVASIATPSGPVPVAQQGYAFPAIAARQQALAERKNNLKAAQEKAMAAFDPFKGIADPADPYQTTFDQYIRDEYATKRNEMAEAGFGGDTAAFDRWVAQTPEGQMWMRTNFTMPVSAVAKENKGRVESVATFLTEAAEFDWDIDPEDYKALQEYTTLINDLGAPLSGVDSRELLLKGRAAERIMSKVRFQKEFLAGFKEFAEQNPSISFSRPPGSGGKIVMEVRSENAFDDYIDAMSESAVGNRMFGKDKKAAKEWMEKLIKKQYDVKVSTFDPYESVERKEAAKAKAESPASRNGQWSYTTRNFISDSRVPGSNDPNSRYEFVSMPMDVGTNKNLVPASPMRLHSDNSPQGELVMVTGFSKPAKGGDWLVLGETVSVPDIGKYNEWRTRNGLPKESMEDLANSKDFGQWFGQYGQKQGKPYQAALSKNKSQIAGKLGSPDPYEFGGVRAALSAANAQHGSDYTTADFESWPREAQEKLMSTYGQ